jgi:DNA-binding helix-hairpin-helix protein with protein kinase domain
VFEFDQHGLQACNGRFEKIAKYDYTYGLPAQSPDLPAIEPEPLPEQVQAMLTLSRIAGVVALLSPFLVLGGVISRGLLLIGIGILVVFGGLWLGLRFFSPLGQEMRRRKAARDGVQAQLNETADTIEHEVNNASHQHGRLREEILQLQRDWGRLPARYRDETAQLVRDREWLARDQFLKQKLLAEHTIPRIGPGRLQTLASFGIETAFDIQARRILAIKGFGQKLTEILVQWRESVLAEFHFDPGMEVPREDRERVALNFSHNQDSIRIQFRQALEQLDTGLQRLQQDIHPLERDVNKLLDALLQTEANLRLLSRV